MSDDPILAAINALTTQVTGLATQVPGLETQATELATQVTGLRTDFFTEIGTTRGAIIGRIDRLQNRFDEMRADVNANFNNAARIEDRGTST